MAIILLLIGAFFQISTHGIFFSPQNITNLITQNSYILILAIGMTLCILTGGNVDLSVGSVCSFTGAVVGYFMATRHFNILNSAVITLIVGILIGFWQGGWIAYARIPSFIVTLSGMLIFRGLSISILNGQTLGPFSSTFQSISGGFLSDFLKNRESEKIFTLLMGLGLILTYIIFKIITIIKNKNYKKEIFLPKIFQIGIVVLLISLLTFSFSKSKGIPNILVLLIFLVGIYSFITKKTVFGRHVYAIGGNWKAAKCSGININKTLLAVYVNMSFLTALSGIVFASRTNSASPQSGINFELDAMAACYVGGASATGGVGTIGGAMIGGAYHWRSQ